MGEIHHLSGVRFSPIAEQYAPRSFVSMLVLVPRVHYLVHPRFSSETPHSLMHSLPNLLRDSQSAKLSASKTLVAELKAELAPFQAKEAAERMTEAQKAVSRSQLPPNLH